LKAGILPPLHPPSMGISDLATPLSSYPNWAICFIEIGVKMCWVIDARGWIFCLDSCVNIC
jgi:hypothetical protein